MWGSCKPFSFGRKSILSSLKGSLADGAKSSDSLASQTQFLYLGALNAAFSGRQDPSIPEGICPVYYASSAKCKIKKKKFHLDES